MLNEQGSRDNNEDSALCLERDGNYCFVVADGLGGHGQGEIASSLVTETFRGEFAKGCEELPARGMEGSQLRIMEMQRIMRAPEAMKTTAVALCIHENLCHWAHVGDSRLYHFQKNKLIQRTLDHSVPQMLVLAGDIKEKQIRRHPDRNRLLRVLGIPWESPQYALGGGVPLAIGQAFLLVTDGFWELIEEKKMLAALKKSRDVDTWLGLMREEVEQNGKGHDMDNYTAIAVVVS
jgi:serine/threonine protein phosphatase PrpC